MTPERQSAVADLQRHFTRLSLNGTDEARRTAEAGLGSIAVLTDWIAELEATVSDLRTPQVAQREREP